MTRPAALMAVFNVAWIALACDSRASKIVDIELPVDTVPGPATVDTVTDTLEIFIPGDTVRDTTRMVLRHDTTEIPVDVSILDYGRTRADLAIVTTTATAAVWVLLELSGNSQKDEAWQLQASGSPVGVEPCAVVPDRPWLGTGWVFVGQLDPGLWELEAVHAIEVECYPPADGFRSANSVHFQAIRLVSTRFEEAGQ